MPKEVRYLLFSNEELYQALTADLRARAHPLPKGFLKRIHVGPADRPDIALVYVSDKGVEATIRFEDQEVVRALIVYCGYRHIPLSAKSTKTLEVRDGVVGLLCTLNFNTDKITTGGGKLSYEDEHSGRMKDTAKTAAKSAGVGVGATKAPL